MDATPSHAEADDVQSAEKKRLNALLQAIWKWGAPTPRGRFPTCYASWSGVFQGGYLGAVAAGILHYLAWELDSPIDVRMYHDVALIRYQAQIELEVQGQGYPRAPYWVTDAYEKRDGQWQIVWSQGTGIA